MPFAADLAVQRHAPIYVRQPTDTCKGQMYRDFGSGDWFFEIDQTSGRQLWSRLAAIHHNPAMAKSQFVHHGNGQ